jgi:hypothetical protein
MSTFRFSCKGMQIVEAGTVVTHNLGLRSGITPDEWSATLVGPTPGGVAVYRTGNPTTSQMTWAASGAATSADIFISITHSIIK